MDDNDVFEKHSWATIFADLDEELQRIDREYEQRLKATERLFRGYRYMLGLFTVAVICFAAYRCWYVG